jgi:protein SCO1/2
MSRPRPARSRAWPLGARGTALLVGGCLAAGAAGALALHPVARHPRAATAPPLSFPSAPAGALTGDAVWAPGRRRAPPFALRDQSNRLVTLSGQRGRAVLLAFMDSHCRYVCTLQGPAIRTILRHVGAGRRVTLLVVSVNPWEDTPASSRAASARYGFGGDWHWLRGSPTRMGPLWRAYGIEVAQTAGDVNHSTAIYLIDARGYERAGFDFPFPTSQVARDLRRLAPSRAS